MASFTEHATVHLKTQGFRLTKSRQMILSVLESCESSLSAYDIKEQLDSRAEKVDIVTIYRILECLESTKLIHRVLSTGKVSRCQFEDDDHCGLLKHTSCHHLLICKRCGRIHEIHCESDDNLVKMPQVDDFVILGHHLEFVGLCKSCA